MSDILKKCENYDIETDAIKEFDKKTILKIYKEICRLRAFEKKQIECIKKNGEGVISRVHLSTGQETVGIALTYVFPELDYFLTHRCTEFFTSLNVPLNIIRDEILCLDTGCAKGKTGSVFAYIKDNKKLHNHTGFIGEQIPIAVGFALASNKKTICVTGDGGAEEDYALQAYGFAATHKLPILFVCNDNDLAIESKVKTRRSWELVELAKAFGMKTFDVTDDPFTLIKIFTDIDWTAPTFINIRVNRNYSHAGIEENKYIKWNRFSIIKEELYELGYDKEAEKIERDADNEMEALWCNYL